MCPQSVAISVEFQRKRRMLLVKLTDTNIELATRIGPDQNVGTTIKLFAIGQDFFPRRIAEYAVEPAFVEYLWKLEFPVEKALTLAYCLELRPPGPCSCLAFYGEFGN